MASNGFRLLYCNKPYYVNCYDDKTKTNTLIDMKIPHKPNYYLINYDKTTIKLNDNDKIHHLFITSMQTKYKKETITIKNKYIEYFNTYKFYKPDDKKNKNKNKNKNKDKDKDKDNKKNYIINDNAILNNIKINNNKKEKKDIPEDFKKLFYLLDKKRLNNYNDWINIVFICKKYGWFNFLLEFSNYSSNNYNKNINNIIISNTFNVNSKYEYNIGTLINFVKKDNNINNTKDFIKLLKDNNINPTEIFKFELTIDKLIYEYNNINYKENNEYISNEAFNNIKDNKDILLISPTGSGKTTTIKKFINYLNYDKILFINSLQTMNFKYCNDFKDLNVKSYLDKSIDINNCNKLSISLEQLYKLNNNFDIIVIDEITSFIIRFYSKTNNFMNENMNKLKELINNSKRCILVDAFIREDTKLLLDFLFNNNLFIYHNINKKHINKNINIINNEFKFKNNIDKILLYLKDKINNKESICIFSDSKKICIDIYNKLNNIYNKNQELDNYFKLYTSKNKSELSFNEIVNCNNEFNNKCIIFSPTIIYGIDILIKYNHNNLFGIYNGNSIDSYFMIQQIGRFRNCNNINLLYNNKNYTFNKYLKLIDIQNKEFNKVENYFKNINNDDKQLFMLKIYQLLVNNIKENEFVNLLKMFGINNINKDLINNELNINIINSRLLIYQKYYDNLLFYNKFNGLNLLLNYSGYNISNNNDLNLININDEIKINNEIINDNKNNEIFDFMKYNNIDYNNYDIIKEFYNKYNDLNIIYKSKILLNYNYLQNYIKSKNINNINNIIKNNNKNDIILLLIYKIFNRLNFNFNNNLVINDNITNEEIYKFCRNNYILFKSIDKNILNKYNNLLKLKDNDKLKEYFISIVYQLINYICNELTIKDNNIIRIKLKSHIQYNNYKFNLKLIDDIIRILYICDIDFILF